MTLDVLLLVTLALAAVRGWSRGGIMALVGLIATLIGLVAALKLAHRFASWLFETGIVTSGWGPLVAFLILFLGIVWAVRWLGSGLEKSVQALHLGWANSLAGAAIQVALSATVWSCLLWLSHRAYFLPAETVATSRLYPYIEPLAPWVFAHLGGIVPFAKDAFGELSDFFDRVNTSLPGRVAPAR